jgi:anti-sigma B factor antagonist
MFSIEIGSNREIVLLGRLDASQTDKAREALDKITESAVVDCKGLEYVSSAGLGVLLAAQKRLKASGHGLKLVNLNGYTRDVFRLARFDLIFEIQ